jgi:predicted dehydrogenase
MKRCILTGLGGRGRHWMSAVQKRDDVEIVAGVEPSEANWNIAVEKGMAPDKIYPSLDDAMQHVQADFVLDVTPPKIHHLVAEKAFASGLHVLGEKPLSDDFSIAKQVADSGARAGVKHMITQNYRFGAQPRTTRKVLEENLIGAPEQCDLRFYMPWADSPGSHYVTEPFMLINDMMVHHFDLMRYVLNADPIAVQAITWNHSWGWHTGDAAHAIVFEFPNNLYATHVSCGCAVGSKTSWNGDWRIEGANGSIDWDNDGTWYSHLHRTAEKVDRQKIEHLRVPASEQAMMDEFFSAIDENREPECSAQDNLKSLAMVFAAIKSTKEKRRVELSELD